MEQVKDTLREEIAWVLVQNKADALTNDQDQVQVTSEEGIQMAKRLGTKYFLTSVGRPGTSDAPMNVDNVFQYLAKEAYRILKSPTTATFLAAPPTAASTAASARTGNVSNATETTPALVPSAKPAVAETVSLKPTKQRTDGKKKCC